MVTIRIGCRNSITSTKERNLDLVLVKGGTTTSTYKAFDASVPDKGKPGEPITVTCPHCSRYVKINTGIEYSNTMVKNLIKMSLFASGGFTLLSGFMGLMLGEISMMWFMMFLTLSLLGLIISGSLIHIKIKSKKGVYYGSPSLADEYHFITYN